MADPKWLEVSMTVDGELAEAVAEVLNRYSLNGIVLEQGIKNLNDEDEGTPEGPIKISGYLPCDDQLEKNQMRLEEALWHLGQIKSLPKPTYRSIEDQDWMSSWKKHYAPIPIGKKLIILPAWLKNNDSQKIPIIIDPGMAFGTGTHPSTQLCLEHLETAIRTGENVIDIGCGSGILSIGAIKLGAGKVLAVDIDPPSIVNTLENAKLNAVQDRIEIGTGSVAEIYQKKYNLSKAPVVVANILAPVILHLFESGMVDLVEPGGVLILAGILENQLESIHTAAQKHGLTHLETRQRLDWVSPMYQK